MLGILRYVDSNPHFFHIHTFNNEKEKWNEGQIISTQNRGKRIFKMIIRILSVKF